MSVNEVCMVNHTAIRLERDAAIGNGGDGHGSGGNYGVVMVSKNVACNGYTGTLI